jgi:hypothetical protein
MSGAVPPLPQYVFMEWCSVRGSKETTFTLWDEHRLRVFKSKVLMRILETNEDGEH